MHWALLILAVLLEVMGTISMKLSYGFSKLVPSIMMFVSYSLCFIVFNFALKHMDVSVAYAIWAGLGTTLVAVIGIIYFNEPSSTLKIASLSMVILGLIGLNLSK
ncbi:MAG: multidrug efflux SMR transporter [Firmicutes bacterium]|nr:multidrug efflux SMR transporter [Bacillota bacterium]